MVACVAGPCATLIGSIPIYKAGRLRPCLLTMQILSLGFRAAQKCMQDPGLWPWGPELPTKGCRHLPSARPGAWAGTSPVHTHSDALGEEFMQFLLLHGLPQVPHLALLR